MTTPEKDSREFEISQLLDAILYKYGYDFRHYARASLERRLLGCMEREGLSSIAAMIPKVMHDPGFFDQMLQGMSIVVTEMFRDPQVFKEIRGAICSQLHTYPRVTVWHAGCATGEEVYSMAILLHEEGLLEKTRIYGTDFNNHSLAVAEKGIYPAKKMDRFRENYLLSGGGADFENYCQVKYESLKMKDFLKEHITFANHNLMNDQVFAEMHLVLCRNVLIYFDKVLQNKVLRIFRDSLIHRGYLLLGDKEGLEFSEVNDAFELQPGQGRIYRKKIHV